MSVQKLDWYDGGRLRTYEAWRLYALFCMRTPSDAVVKIGVSSIVYQRMLSLKTGMPYPMGVCLHASVGDRSQAARFEAALHRAFADRNTRGEWFEFNLADPVDKFAFHNTMNAVFRSMFVGELKWDKITPEQLDAYAALMQQEAKEKKARKKSRPLY